MYETLLNMNSHDEIMRIAEQYPVEADVNEGVDWDEVAAEYERPVQWSKRSMYVFYDEDYEFSPEDDEYDADEEDEDYNAYEADKEDDANEDADEEAHDYPAYEADEVDEAYIAYDDYDAYVVFDYSDDDLAAAAA